MIGTSVCVGGGLSTKRQESAVCWFKQNNGTWGPRLKSVRYLPRKYENLGSCFQHPHKKLGMEVGSCNPSSEEAENSSGFGEKDWAAIEEYTQF